MKSDYKPSAVTVGAGTIWLSEHPTSAVRDLSPTCDYCRRAFASNLRTNCEGCGAPRTISAEVTTGKPIHFYSDESEKPVYTAYV